MRRPSDDAATGAPDGRSGISWSSRSKTAIRLIAAIGTLGLTRAGPGLVDAALTLEPLP